MGGNRRTRRKPTTFGSVLTNSSHVRSDVRYRARTHDLNGGRILITVSAFFFFLKKAFFPFPNKVQRRLFLWFRQARLAKKDKIRISTSHLEGHDNVWHSLQDYHQRRWQVVPPCSRLIQRSDGRVRDQSEKTSSERKISRMSRRRIHLCRWNRDKAVVTVIMLKTIPRLKSVVLRCCNIACKEELGFLENE